MEDGVMVFPEFRSEMPHGIYNLQFPLVLQPKHA